MLLRRITEHVKAQNWTAVAFDFFIVVVGVFVGLQAQQWTVERERRASEQGYLSRLHGDIEKLLDLRAHYDNSRPKFTAQLEQAVAILYSGEGDIGPELCTAIAASAYTTNPPANLPTAVELLSAGRLDVLRSETLRAALLEFLQEAARTEVLVNAQSSTNKELTGTFPELVRIRYGAAPASLGAPDSMWINPHCNADGMRMNAAFMNQLGENAYIYNVYTYRGILPASRALTRLHAELDTEMGITHATEGHVE